MLLMVALAFAMMLPLLLVIVEPVRVKLPLATGAKVRDCTVWAVARVTVPAAPVPGLPPKMAAAPERHTMSVRPLLNVQFLLALFHVPLPLSIRPLLSVLSHVKAAAEPLRAQNIFCSFCAKAGRL